MSRKTAVLAAAITGIVLGSSSVSQAVTDTHTDNNPLTINNKPTWSAYSFNSGAFVQADPNDPSLLTAGPNTIKENSNGTLTFTNTDTTNDGGTIGTALNSDYNFWQHPVTLTVHAPVGGNLMPTGVTVPNESFLYLGLTANAGSRLDAGTVFYIQLSNADPGDQIVTTQYVAKANNVAQINDATPTFGGGGFPKAFPTDSTVTSLTLTLDGSSYNRATNTGDLFFNWGATVVTSDGVSHDYWRFNTAPGVYGNQYGTRHDVAWGPGDAANGGWALGKTNLPTLYDAWTAAGTNSVDGLIGDSALAVEFKQNNQGGPGVKGPSSVTIGDIITSGPIIRYPGDANNDGFVDSTDFGILINNYLTSTGAGPDAGDFNNDGMVDSTDFGILINNYLTGPNPHAELEGSVTPSLAVAVPEPTCLAMLAAVPALLVRRRRAK